MPAVCASGVPVLPETVPGAAVSPGTSNCSFVKTPAVTLIEELVLGVLLPSLMSLAVTVRVPAVLMVTLKLAVPLESVALGGRLALASEEVIPMVSAASETMFQLSSTALTVTLNGVPAV